VNVVVSAFATTAAPVNRWVMWAVPTVLFMITWVHRPAPGVIARELMQTFGAGGTMIGLLSAAYFYTYAGLMIPSGVLVDAFGVRRVLATGGIVMAAGALAMAAAPNEAVLFAGRLAAGAGSAVAFVGALKVAATWFPPSRFGFLAALTATVGSFGAFLATAPLAWVVSLTSWRGAFAAIAVWTFVVAALTWLVVRDREEPSTGAASPRSVMVGTLEVLRNLKTWPPFFAFFFLYSAFGNLMLWAIPYLRDVYGMTRGEAATVASATTLALLGAGPLVGWCSDRFRRRRAPYIALVGALAVNWVVFVATLGRLPVAGVTAILFLMGTFGAAFVLVWPLGRDVNPPRLSGVAVAVVNFGGFLGVALAQGPIGMLLDARWQGLLVDGARVYPLHAYRVAFLVCTLFVVISGAAGLLLTETGGENVSREAP
jgi:MFS family permease